MIYYIVKFCKTLRCLLVPEDPIFGSSVLVSFDAVWNSVASISVLVCMEMPRNLKCDPEEDQVKPVGYQHIYFSRLLCGEISSSIPAFIEMVLAKMLAYRCIDNIILLGTEEEYCWLLASELSNQFVSYGIFTNVLHKSSWLPHRVNLYRMIQNWIYSNML